LASRVAGFSVFVPKYVDRFAISKISIARPLKSLPKMGVWVHIYVGKTPSGKPVDKQYASSECQALIKIDFYYIHSFL
jgi:hypothetical protein